MNSKYIARMFAFLSEIHLEQACLISKKNNSAGTQALSIQRCGASHGTVLLITAVPDCHAMLQILDLDARRKTER